jgi:hypothetical protein
MRSTKRRYVREQLEMTQMIFATRHPELTRSLKADSQHPRRLATGKSAKSKLPH